MAAYTIAQLDTASMTVKNIDPTEKPGRGVLFFRYITIDFDKLETSAGTTLANNDTYQLFHLAVGELVLQAGAKVLTAATAAADLGIGFTSVSANHFVEALIVDDIHIGPTVTTGMLSPAYCQTADTLDLVTVDQTLAGAVIEFWALIARF